VIISIFFFLLLKTVTLLVEIAVFSCLIIDTGNCLVYKNTIMNS